VSAWLPHAAGDHPFNVRSRQEEIP